MESKLMERIEAGAERSIIFYLKTRGRRRGFQEGGSCDDGLLSDDALSRLGSPYKGMTSRFDAHLHEPDIENEVFEDQEGVDDCYLTS
ncbi:MAG: hypothetical protein V4662_26095 [Verrucomicrobiota bacterium]